LSLGSPAFRQPSTPCLQTTPQPLTPLRKLMVSTLEELRIQNSHLQLAQIRRYDIPI